LRKGTLSTRERIAAAGLTLACALAIAAPASAQTGGTPPPGSTTPAPTTTTTPTGPAGKATLTQKGKAIPPSDAPWQVVAAITAGNQIRKMPYRWGGGHASFYDSGYDCSGAVSYVLHAAGLLTSPMVSGAFASSWGSYGRGRWITVYANGGHMYAVIAGVRFDTSAVGESVRQGSGPRWRATKRKPTSYVPRYYPSL
jgi:cell wall-associated NlpC family hydrolase